MLISEREFSLQALASWRQGAEQRLKQSGMHWAVRVLCGIVQLTNSAALSELEFRNKLLIFESLLGIMSDKSTFNETR
jgi:hypothetical protein